MSGDLPDAVELLAAMAPDAGPRPLQRGDDPSADRMLHRIMVALEGDATPSRGRRRRTGRVGVSLVAAALAAGASAVAAVRRLGDEDARVVSCWGDASAVAQWEVRLDDGASPIDACRLPWVDGPLGTTGPPSMSICRAASGAIAVVPGGDGVCTVAGLGSADEPSARPDAVAIDDLRRSVVEPLFAGCLDEPATRALLAHALDDGHLGTWRVVAVVPFSPTRPCGRVSLDAGTHTIYLAPTRDG